MGVASILLAFLAGLLCLLGFLTAWIPVVGTVLAFGAPVAALVGITLGGMAWSRAREAGRSADMPVVAVIMNVLALVPALLVAFTCGVCNALVSSGPVHIEHHWGTGLVDAGWLPAPADFPRPARAGGDAGLPSPMDPALDAQPDEGPAELPPPSLPAGPRTPLPPAPDGLP